MKNIVTLPVLLLLVLISAIGLNVLGQEKPCENNDARKLQGVYRFPDGRLVSIIPLRTAGQWRYIDFSNGESHRLSPTDQLNFRSANDWDSAEPVGFRYRFHLGTSGAVESLTVQQNGKSELAANKVSFREQPANFQSGDIQLFGKLYMPAIGKAPFKTVVFVHGSDNAPSVDREWQPQLLAANGIATFVYDKRGTGCSKGQYLQHFGVLSDDVVAAVRWLKARPEVDRNRIGLAGFSQGGWIAPLAALKDPDVKFVLIGYGLAMSVAEEDRLEGPLRLKAEGFDDASIAQFEELNGTIHKVAKDGFKNWLDLDKIIDKYKDTGWFANVKGSQTWAGSVLGMGFEQAKIVAPQMFGTFFQPFYDPVPTLESLNIPMCWLLARDDIEAPSGPTIAVLKRLKNQGKPFTTRVFPNSGHGIKEFVVRDGRRVTTKYADDYFSALLKWIQSQK